MGKWDFVCFEEGQAEVELVEEVLAGKLTREESFEGTWIWMDHLYELCIAMALCGVGVINQ